jgi:hypothetical protein
MLPKTTVLIVCVASFLASPVLHVIFSLYEVFNPPCKSENLVAFRCDAGPHSDVDARQNSDFALFGIPMPKQVRVC